MASFFLLLLYTEHFLLIGFAFVRRQPVTRCLWYCVVDTHLDFFFGSGAQVPSKYQVQAQRARQPHEAKYEGLSKAFFVGYGTRFGMCCGRAFGNLHRSLLFFIFHFVLF